MWKKNSITLLTKTERNAALHALLQCFANPKLQEAIPLQMGKDGIHLRDIRIFGTPYKIEERDSDIFPVLASFQYHGVRLYSLHSREDILGGKEESTV